MNQEKKEKDIFNIGHPSDKTAVSKKPEPANAPDTGDETVGPRFRQTFKESVLKKRKREPMFGIGFTAKKIGANGEELERWDSEGNKREGVQKVTSDDRMPENEVRPHKKEEEK